MVGKAAPDEGILASLPTLTQISLTLPASGFTFTNDISAPRSLLNALGFNVSGLNGDIDADINFSTGFLAPLAFGLMLDLAGGARSTLAWGLAFLLLALGPLLALPILARMGRQGPESD